MQYNEILKIVYTQVFGETSNSTSGIFVKLDATFETYFQTELLQQDKDELLKSHQKNIQALKPKEVFVVYDGVFYKINDEFHITTLFTGGKPVIQKNEDVDVNLNDELETQLGKQFEIKLEKLAVSKDFIVIGVGELECSYYGNPIKHITIGLSKSGKKVFPKDSYTALSNGTVYAISNVVHGLTSKCTK
jgi:hypothetical protein